MAVAHVSSLSHTCTCAYHKISLESFMNPLQFLLCGLEVGPELENAEYTIYQLSALLAHCHKERQRECTSPSHNSAPHLWSASVGGFQGDLLSGMMSLVALVMASHSGS